MPVGLRPASRYGDALHLHPQLSTKIAIYTFALASASAGLLDLIWREFEPAHQPIQAWGDRIPGITILAFIAGLALITGGLAMLRQSTLRFGAAMLTVVYGIFVLFPLPRIYTAPHYLGVRAPVYISVLASICQQLILFLAAAAVWQPFAGKSRQSHFPASVARWSFGASAVIFGLAHLTAAETVLPMIPKWFPPGASFWVTFTGIAFILAGLAIIAGVLDVLAAWLLGLMLLLFSMFSLAPMIPASPRNHVAWGANAYNLTAVGAAWIFAAWLASHRNPIPAEPSQFTAPSV